MVPARSLNRLGEKQPRRQYQRSSVLWDTRSRNMRSHLYGAIAIAAMIATPATRISDNHEHAPSRRRNLPRWRRLP